MLTHLNSSVCNLSSYMDVYKGFRPSLICTGPSEFAHNSPNVWRNDVRVEAEDVESWELCLWSDGVGWELTLEQASPGWRTVFCSHVVEHQARCLKSTTVGVSYSSGKLAKYRVLMSQPVLLGGHNKPEIKEVLLRVTRGMFHWMLYVRDTRLPS